MDYRVLISSPEVSASYGVEVLPTTVVVDGKGRVVGAHTGVLTLPQLMWMVPDSQAAR